MRVFYFLNTYIVTYSIWAYTNARTLLSSIRAFRS